MTYSHYDRLRFEISEHQVKYVEVTATDKTQLKFAHAALTRIYTQHEI
jgi:hypothetical protein